MIGGMASTRGSSWVESWALAAERRTASGIPFRSTTRWYLEPALPRSVGLGPVCFAPLFGPDAEAVQARPAPVDGRLVAEPVQQPGVQPLPDAGRLPVAQPPPAGDAAAAAQLPRQQPPRAAGAQHEDDAAEGGTVGNAGTAALGLGRLLRQERLDGFPEIVGDKGRVLHGPDMPRPRGSETRTKPPRGWWYFRAPAWVRDGVLKPTGWPPERQISRAGTDHLRPRALGPLPHHPDSLPDGECRGRPPPPSGRQGAGRQRPRRRGRRQGPRRAPGRRLRPVRGPRRLAVYTWKRARTDDQSCRPTWATAPNKVTGRCSVVAPRNRNAAPLAETHPDLAAEWHPSRNGDLTSHHVVAGSEKKIWWRCPKGPDHAWQATAANRTRLRSGCPYCAGQRASVTNSLAALFPDIAAQWHPTKNGALTPDGVVSGSNKHAWWRCSKNPGHEWRTTVANRTRRGGGCPYCSGRRVSVTNSLATLCPEVAAEWHPTRNGDLTPDDVVAGSHLDAWWRCRGGPDHEWRAVVVGRTREGRGCPFCRNQRLSVTNSLAALFPDVAVQWHPTRNGDLTPDLVIAGILRRRRGGSAQPDPDHEWPATLYSRTAEAWVSVSAPETASRSPTPFHPVP